MYVSERVRVGRVIKCAKWTWTKMRCDTQTSRQNMLPPWLLTSTQTHTHTNINATTSFLFKILLHEKLSFNLYSFLFFKLFFFLFWFLLKDPLQRLWVKFVIKRACTHYIVGSLILDARVDDAMRWDHESSRRFLLLLVVDVFGIVFKKGIKQKQKTKS